MFAYANLSNGTSKEISQAEVTDRSLHRRSIHTRKPLKAGHVVSEGDLEVLRPGKGGMDPRVFHSLAGRVIKHDLSAQHQLQMADLVGQDAE
jgi:N-acetylneuraminate synthase